MAKKPPASTRREFLRDAAVAAGSAALAGALNMVEKDIQVFQWDGTTLKDTGTRIKVKGGSAALRTADH
jgi:ferric-dicitrate binding protein FerR (iron transport regulator)